MTAPLADVAVIAARLRALLEFATPGPWACRHDLDWGVSSIKSGNPRHPIIADVPRSTLAHVNAALIVEAVNALPSLLAAFAERQDGWRVPDDWRLVPVEPTQEMVDAWASAFPPFVAGQSDDDSNAAAARADWTAMLAAVPTPPSCEGRE